MEIMLHTEVKSLFGDKEEGFQCDLSTFGHFAGERVLSSWMMQYSYLSDYYSIVFDIMSRIMLQCTYI